MRTWTKTPLLAAVILVSSVARAQAPSASPDPEDLFRRAREAMEKKDYAVALPLLRESNTLSPGRGKLLNLAICEEQIGLFATASRRFQAVLDQLPEDDDRRAIAKEHLDALGPRVPLVRIRLSASAPVGSRVMIDGVTVPLSALGSSIPLDPGDHSVVVTAPERRDHSYRLHVKEGEHLTADVAPTPSFIPSMETAAPPVVEPPSTPKQKIAGIVIGSAGLFTVAIGGFVGVDVLAKKDRSDKGCGADGCDTASHDLRVAILEEASAATGILLTGAALTALGTTLFLTAPRLERAGAPRVALRSDGFWLVGTW